MAEHVVAGEHGVFFVEDEGHVVGGVSRAVKGAKTCAFDVEVLSVLNRFLADVGVVFVDFGFRAESEEIFDTADVVGVPVC